MAWLRIGGTPCLLTNLSRVPYAASAPLEDIRCTRYPTTRSTRADGLHVTSIRRYPDPPTLPLPTNVSEIFANETGRFTPERARDIAAPIFMYGSQSAMSSSLGKVGNAADRSTIPPIRVDIHVDSYDCFGAISLNGSMQSNVPKPFSSRGKSTHLNMPGGQWARDGKYIAEDMQNSHYRSVRAPGTKPNQPLHGSAANAVVMSSLLQTLYRPHISSVAYSTMNSGDRKSNGKNKAFTLTPQERRERLKKIMKDYGGTVLVFHITISLVSLAGIYFAIALCNIDLTHIIERFTSDDNENLTKILNSSSNLVLAYAVHKCFAPLRIGLTLAATPPLVRYLRARGILKPLTIK